MGDRRTWININVADGGQNAFDALGGDPDFKLTGWQQGQLEVSYTPLSQTDVSGSRTRSSCSTATKGSRSSQTP